MTSSNGHEIMQTRNCRVRTTASFARCLVTFLQGIAAKPQGKHLLQAALVLKWLRRHPTRTLYPRMQGPFKLLVHTDAAYKPEENLTPHARRDKEDTGAIPCHVLDYCSKWMLRITRSAFAAELQGVIAGVDNGIALSMTCETILSGTELADAEFNHRSLTGSLLVPCEVLTDSWSLYLAGKQGNSKLPEEKPYFSYLQHCENTSRHQGSDVLDGAIHERWLLMD
eukprot:6490747-Amphidinium_carterae.1